ncbi:hypothetical protein CWB77_00680 [Pseudoalteromonas sp. S1610]|nr:hypothetical protein DK924_15275 [Pseudoalteromonas sp. meg-B1]TMP64130.1 hypothetical protein CWB77_00680 [Pseudoalteromonas sp. S1610]TMP75842.1 hypothetical protein CWB75_04165 [Pseudoalteromonas sp. S1608]TMS63276.1 hypothetical protein CWC10_02965 [Pseudoalteromonas sp. S3173]
MKCLNLYCKCFKRAMLCELVVISFI